MRAPRAGTARRRALGVTATLAVAAGGLAPALAAGQPEPAAPQPRSATEECTWSDPSLPAAERAQLLLDASTLEQRMRWLVEQPAIQPTRTEWPDGVVYPEQVPCTPDLTFANGAYGLDGPGGTAFPVPIAEASAWDEQLSQRKGEQVAREAHRGGRSVVLGPGMAGGRTPLSGRTPEYYGEDPVLSGALAGASARGLEGVPEAPVLANLKHYVANEQELDRETSSSNMTERTRRQLYDLSFEIAAAESEAGSIMCSFNQVNGVYTCESPIMNDVIKDDWGYEGFIMSDFGSVHSTADSLDAGLDMELNRPVWFTPEKLHAALEAGVITEEQIDAAAFRVVRTFIGAGLFDNPASDPGDEELPTPPESRELAREMAEKGSVLLTNDGLLPLADEPQHVAVIGAWASSEPTDGVSARTVCSAFLPFGGGRSAVPCPDPVAPLDALTERVTEAGGTVTFDPGTDPASAAEVAADADVALVFGHYTTGEFSDLEDLNLDGGGDALVQAVAEANPRTAAVLAAGSAVEMPWVEDVAAVLHTWYPGLEMGNAITRIAFGDVNPSGKLPMTFPRSLADTPTQTPEQYPGVFADGSTERTDPDAIRQVEYSEGLQVGYRWYDAQGIEPLFEFGHGLSYTSYEYDKLRVTPRRAQGGAPVDVRFRVTNTGDRAGTEIAQVYLELPAEAGEPAHRLVGWERVELAPGEHANVRVRLDAHEIATRHLLEYWDEDADGWVSPAGEYTVQVGSSSRNLPLEGTLRVG